MTQNTPMTTPSEQESVPNILPQLDAKTIIDTAANQAVLEILSIVQAHGLTASSLRDRLNQPVFSKQNIQHYLNHCTPAELAAHFYEAGIQKVIETAAKHQAKNQNAPAPNPTEASSSTSVPDDEKPKRRNRARKKPIA